MATPSIVDNMRRSATATIIFAFFINPPLACAFLGFETLRSARGQVEGYQIRLILSLLYLMAAFIFIPVQAYYREIKRLENLGITLQPSRFPRGRRLDWGLNVAICAAIYFWGVKEGNEGGPADPLLICVKLALLFLAMWLGGTLALLGRIWYFAAEAPTAATQQADRVRM